MFSVGEGVSKKKKFSCLSHLNICTRYYISKNSCLLFSSFLPSRHAAVALTPLEKKIVNSYSLFNSLKFHNFPRGLICTISVLFACKPLQAVSLFSLVT